MDFYRKSVTGNTLSGSKQKKGGVIKPNNFGHYSFHQQLWLLGQFQTLTLVSSFWDCLQHRSPCCTCSGTRSQRRGLKLHSPLLGAWRWVQSGPLHIRFCSRPRGKTTDRLLSTPSRRCHLRGRAAANGMETEIQREARESRLVMCGNAVNQVSLNCFLMLHGVFIQLAKRFQVRQKEDAWILVVTCVIIK